MKVVLRRPLSEPFVPCKAFRQAYLLLLMLLLEPPAMTSGALVRGGQVACFLRTSVEIVVPGCRQRSPTEMKRGFCTCPAR